jgi:hypothetical protein
MYLHIKLTIFLIFLSYLSVAQEIVGVTHIKTQLNNSVIIRGDLSEGTLLDDLSWAWNSNVECFPEVAKQYFTGNHVLFSTNLPAFSEIEIKLIPQNKADKFSLYAYSINLANSYIVPNLPSCLNCQAQYKCDKYSPQSGTLLLSGLSASEVPYRIVIGVVGVSGLTKGAFTLEILLKQTN